LKSLLQKKVLWTVDLTVPKTAAALVQAAMQTGDPYCAAAVYSIASSEQCKELEAVMFGKRRDALMLARWEHTPAAVLQALAQNISRNMAAGTSDAAVEVRLDKNPGTPSQALSRLYAGEAHDVGKHTALTVLIAQHQHTPTNVLEKIAQFESDIESLKAVSRNPAAEGHVLRALLARMASSQGHEIFDKNVAANPSTPADLLEHIYAEGDAYTRAAVIAHANCPQSVIDSALSDDDVPIMVLRQLAGDKRLPQDVLAKLAGSADVVVRCSVAANLALPNVLVRWLSNDDSHAVRRAIAVRPDLTAASINRLMTDTDTWVRLWLGRNTAVSRMVLEKLSTDAIADVRRAVARNPHCPVKLLGVLATDEDAWVRSAVAYQKNAPKYLLESLAEDTDIDVLSGVASNAHTPQPILRKLAASPEADVRRGVILNRKATRTTLLPLLEDPYYLHRLMLAASPKLKSADKWPLCGDPDAKVRFAAYRWLAGFLDKASLGKTIIK
jgi:hypothetical protein